MRPAAIASTLALAALAATLAMAPGFAQAPQQPGQQMLPPGGFKPPPAPAVKAYKPVAVSAPAQVSDPNFAAFRKSMADAAGHKDRAALAKLVAAKDFFWMQDKDLADKQKSGIDNLAKAIDLDNKDGSGWEIVAAFAADPTGAEVPDQKGIICAPAGPNLDQKAVEELATTTQTDMGDWAYPSKDGIEVHASTQPNSPVVEKLGMFLVRVLPDTAPPSDANAPPLLHVALPSGKTGFVAADGLLPLGQDQMCYAKEGGSWKIAGYVGGASQ